MQTDEIRAALVERLGGELLEDYGVQLTGFTILNVNVDPEDEKRIRRVEDIDVFDSRFDRYREMRQMDMMDTAVTREGSSNQMMDAGMGLAMGQMFGGMMGQQMGGQPATSTDSRYLHQWQQHTTTMVPVGKGSFQPSKSLNT